MSSHQTSVRSIFERQSYKITFLCAILLIVLALSAFFSLLIGAGHISSWESLNYLLGNPAARADAHLEMVVMTLRAPRTVVAMIVGCAFGVAGVLLQTATRNPLAETGLLGVNAGAALGVVIGITYAQAESGYAYLLWAFGGALVGNTIVLLIAQAGQSITPLRLILAGAALGATFRGLTAYILLSSLLTYDQYRFWILGSLSGVTFTMLREVLPAIMLGLLIALLMSRPLSALLLGDDIARSLGHRPELIRVVVTTAVTLMTGAAVALAGPITFLGLLAPHIARAIVGPRINAQIGIAALVGAVILLVADILARLVIRPFETPVSVVIALIGAPLLVWIVRSHHLLHLNISRAEAHG